ncbi:O-methyltransferase [Streptomyces sp. B6B3]|uniref:O-methyltransferase n=1 Tax=Streptomyces sp. B6B3 TaxID=3153570 RepID=UPI00325EDED7
MPEQLWSDVDRYLVDLLLPVDPELEAAARDSAAEGLPAISVSPTQGKLLHLIARISGARRILEIGTLGGYSTIWLARALPPDGRLTTLEADPHHAEVARRNIARAGLADVVDIRIGPALETLPTLADEAPFDLVFIDADKPNNPEYHAWSLRLSRPGTVIIGDNVVRNGAVLDADSTDPGVVGTRRYLERVGAEPRLTATAVQTVGAKGYDGFTLAVVEE